MAWKKIKNLPSWLVIFLLVPLFSKDLITFKFYFVSLYVRVITKPVIDEIPFYIFFPVIVSPVSSKTLLSISLGSLFIYSFPNKFFIKFADDLIF